MSYDKLINGYLAHADAVAHDREDVNFWAYEDLHRLITQDCDAAWLTVTTVIESVPDDATLEYVSADVLEDLICEHPYLLIDKVESLALVNERFKKAVSNVWGWSILPSEITIRLDQLCSRQTPHL